MFGSAMSPDKWNRTGGISISAPEQIKAVSPPRASNLQPLPPVERPTEAQLLLSMSFRKVKFAGAFAQQQPPPAEVVDPLMLEVAQSTEASALATGALDGSKTCQALLQGSLSPAAFGRAVSMIPDKQLLAWATEFGRCVRVLGHTLLSLRAQVDRELTHRDWEGTRRAVSSVTARARLVRAELGEVRRETLTTIDATQAALAQTICQAASELARRCEGVERRNRLELDALLSAHRTRTTLLREFGQLDALLAPAADGTRRTATLVEVAERICHASRVLVGGCLDVSLYIQLGGVSEGEAAVRANPDALGGASARRRTTTTTRPQPRLYRILPPRGLRSAAEDLLADSLVLDAPAFEIARESLAGMAVSRGQLVHVARDVGELPHYHPVADRTAHLPPPSVLLYVPIPTGGLAVAGFNATLRLAMPTERSTKAVDRVTNPTLMPPARRDFTSTQIEALQAGAHAFGLALRGCFAVAEDELRARRVSLLDNVVDSTILAPTAPLAGAANVLASAMAALHATVRRTTEAARAAHGATRATLWLNAAETGALYTLAEDAKDLSAPAKISLSIESPTQLTLMGEGVKAYEGNGAAGATGALPPKMGKARDTPHLGDGRDTPHLGKARDTPHLGDGRDTPHLGKARDMPHLGDGRDVLEGDGDEEDKIVLERVILELDNNIEPRSALMAGAIAVHAAATGDGAPVNISDSRAHFLTRPPLRGEPSVAILAVPFYSSTSAELLGVLELHGTRGGSCFTANDVALLQAHLRLAALEIEHHMLRAKLAVAVTD
jgi:GAF domain-containing protein